MYIYHFYIDLLQHKDEIYYFHYYLLIKKDLDLNHYMNMKGSIFFLKNFVTDIKDITILTFIESTAIAIDFSFCFRTISKNPFIDLSQGKIKIKFFKKSRSGISVKRFY